MFITHSTSSPSVICNFSPSDGVRHKVNERVAVNVTCTNKMFSIGQTIVIITLDPGPGDSLKLCVEQGNLCHLSSEVILLNMTREETTYRLQVAATGLGIRCLKETSVYQRGKFLYPSSSSDEGVQLLYNMSGMYLDDPSQMEIPDEYTEVFVIKQETKKVETTPPTPVRQGAEERMISPEEVLLVDLIKNPINITYKMLNEVSLQLWHEYEVYTFTEKTSTERQGAVVSRILTIIVFCGANFIIGTGMNYRVFFSLGMDAMSSYIRCDCCSRLFSMRAWKVGLFCQVFYPPILSFALGKLIFRDGVQCDVVVDLSRLGLFLLGTAPGSTAATYFSALWDGDLELSVGLVILSTVICPITTLVWWATLGRILLRSSTSDNLVVPFVFILEFLALIVIPMAVGMGLAGKFTCVRLFMEQIRKTFIVWGMLGFIVIYYFQYHNFMDIFSTSHMLACGALTLGSAFLAGITAYFCHLNRSQIVSIAIDCAIQNGTLCHAVISGSLVEPESLYASSPAKAQILFTSAPIVVVWILWTGVKMFLAFKASKKSTQVTSGQNTLLGGDRGEEGYQTVQVGNIKEAWADQAMLRPLWV
eukprot:GFUD01003859.1.p1 GENE.GFUD01003859.1~~GFUD01003859.1.p1  ORF type:complete len:610 (-),score=127.75 GFUD01003859.1:65-1834(-)